MFGSGLLANKQLSQRSRKQNGGLLYGKDLLSWWTWDADLDKVVRPPIQKNTIFDAIMAWWIMTIRIPLLPIEFEFIARRRTEPFRFRVRTLLIATAVTAVITYLLLPLSAADCRLMAIYEHLGNFDFANESMTLKQVIEQIGPPSTTDIPSIPNEAPGDTWVASFDTPLQYQQFVLGLSFDSPSGELIACGLERTDYQGLALLWFRLESVFNKVRL